MSVRSLVPALLLLIGLPACGKGGTGGTGPAPVNAPDIVSTGMSYEPDPVNVGEIIDFTVQIKNQGGVAGGKFECRAQLFYNYFPNPIPPCPGPHLWGTDSTVVPTGLLAGASKTINFSFLLPDETRIPPGCPPLDPDFSGYWFITVTVDHLNELAEDNGSGTGESNNSASYSLTVTLNGS